MHSAPVELLPSNAIFWLRLHLLCSSGSLLSNGDGDGNENVKKAIGLDEQNNNFACASRALHFLAVTTRQWREIPSSGVLWRA